VPVSFVGKKLQWPLFYIPVLCDGHCIVSSPFYGVDGDSSDEEMSNNKFVGDNSLGASEFHSRLLLADTFFGPSV
jgi:hypothetical protein